MTEPAGLDAAVAAATDLGLKISREEVAILLKAASWSELQGTIAYVSGRNSRINRQKTPGRLHRLLWEGERMPRGDMARPGIVGVCTEGDSRMLQEGGRYSTTDLVRLEAMHCGLPDPFPRGSYVALPDS